MSEFDKHWDGWAIASNCTEDEAKIHFEAGQQSQQAKIDELKMSNHHLAVQLNDAGDFYDYEKKRADELQGRINEAIERASHAHIGYPMLSMQFDDVLKILKGKEDEN